MRLECQNLAGHVDQRHRGALWPASWPSQDREAIMITDRTFFSFLKCGRKAFLQAAGNPGEQPDIDRVQRDLDALYRRRAVGVLLGAYQPADVVVDPASWAAI